MWTDSIVYKKINYAFVDCILINWIYIFKVSLNFKKILRTHYDFLKIIHRFRLSCKKPIKIKPEFKAI